MGRTSEIVVIGGGYSGVLAANRLTARDDVRVTLINPRGQFVERIRLHQAAAGTHPAVVAFPEVLAKGVRLVVDTATRIDPTARAVTLATGDRLGYDHLVYAVGSHARAPDLPGADLVHPVATLEGATRLRAALEAAPPGTPVTVVGAGSTGIEVAAELAEQGHPVSLVCGGELNPYLHGRGRRLVHRHLARLGVRVVDGGGSRVVEVTPRSVRLADGGSLPSGVTVWTAGFAVPDLARRSGLATDAAGRLVTDETLTSVSDPRVVATGDASSPSAAPFRMCCASAVQLGIVAAQTLAARLVGETPADLSVGFAGQCIGLGRRDGVLQVARRDDRALGLAVGGRSVGGVKEAVSRAVTRQIAREAASPGSFRVPGWVADPRRADAVRDRPDTSTGCMEEAGAGSQDP